jgi:sugar lactone lactonase YvrE
MEIAIERIGATRDALGEGPLWDARGQVLYWLDSMAGRIHRYDPVSAAYASLVVPGHKIGSLAVRENGGLVLALTDGFYGFDFTSGRLTAILLPEAGEERVRFNDGKVDRQGRFLAGTVVRPGCEEPLGKLYRLNAEGSADIIETGLHIANGPCFSPDGSRLYFTDSLTRKIWAYDYFADERRPANRTVLFDTEALGTLPDGATVDSDGCIWTALVMIGKIGRVTPDGRLDRTIDMPVPHPTSMTFGGAALDVLYVTSVSSSETGRFQPTDPQSGGLFAVHGLGVKGIAEPRFGGAASV